MNFSKLLAKNELLQSRLRALCLVASRLVQLVPLFAACTLGETREKK